MIDLFRRVAVGDIDYPQEPPLFDWREQMNVAKSIIAKVGKPVRVLSVNGFRERKGVDLSGKEESLARLLAEVAEEYHVARSYTEAQALPIPRIRPSVRKNPAKKPGKFARLHPEYVYPPEDCAGNNSLLDGLPKRGKGNPSKSRDEAEFPIGPLNPVYALAKPWWEEVTGRSLAPTFAGGDDVIVKGAEYDEDIDEADEVDMGSEYNNAGSRFILAVFNFVEPSCKASHARDLCIRIQKLSE